MAGSPVILTFVAYMEGTGRMRREQPKRRYVKPALKKLGSVADITGNRPTGSHVDNFGFRKHAN
jgi:hypothetical protein